MPVTDPHQAYVEKLHDDYLTLEEQDRIIAEELDKLLKGMRWTLVKPSDGGGSEGHS